MNATEGHPAAERVEKVLARAAVFFRVCGLIEVYCVITLDARQYLSIPPVIALVSAVTVESVAFAGLTWQRSTLSRSSVTVDVAFQVGCLVLSSWVTPAAYGQTWVFFMYPFTVLTCYSIGIAYQRFWEMAAVTSLLLAGYAPSAIVFHHDHVWNVIPNGLTYYVNIAVFLAARELRRSGRSEDASRRAAIAQAAELAQEREKQRHARMLHDRVLQTLEILAQHRGVSVDEGLRSRVVAEAIWLRALVEGIPVSDSRDLLVQLEELSADRTAAGLRVELNCAQLREAVRSRIPELVVHAVVGAVGEALTNVAKHSRSPSAVVRATLSGAALTVTVLDYGAGFDASLTPPGVGLGQCITRRVQEVGGHVCVESSPGAGTYIEMVIPVP